MKLEFIFLVLVVAGANSGHENRTKNDRKFLQRKYGFKCPPRIETTSLPETTSTTTTTTSDPCDSCRSEAISIGDTWAGQCFPDRQPDGTCACLCGDVFCFNGEIIDRSTCTPNGRLQDCKCISTSTLAPTTATTMEATTVGTTETTTIGYQ